MSAATGLMQALLGPGTPPDVARAALDEALLSEVDPLHWCATHLRVPDAEVMRRAADWAGLAFLDAVPRLGDSGAEPERIDRLADIRMRRIALQDREIVIAAPDFFGVIRMEEFRRKYPTQGPAICLIPAPAMREHLVAEASAALVESARQTMARHWPRAAAQLELTTPMRHAFACLLLALAAILVVGPMTGFLLLMPLWLLLVLIPSFLRLAALCLPVAPDPQLGPLADLPVYTVLVPLRDEAHMVDQLCACLGGLDYPAEKLEIIFVVESSSPETVASVRRHLDDPRFSLLVVPDALPRTKPKALSFALPLCRGEFLVVYDAEDRPAPGQLRQVAACFDRDPEVACVQARLVIDNGGRSLLPSLFAGEYAALFSVLLPALARWGLVMPLGGTSNHFRTTTLRALGGWDSFNVTEDADLGVRLARRHLRCATCLSATLEAAPTRWSVWLGQRTRWMKGWMQTYVVHNRHMPELVSDLGWRGMLMLQVVLLGMLLAPLLHAGFLIVLIVHLLTGQLAWPMVEPWPLACIVVLVVGDTCAIATNLVGLSRTGQRHLWAWQALLPVYWVLIWLATQRAMREFTLRPFHWFKSPHSTSDETTPGPEAGPPRATEPAHHVYAENPGRVETPA
ncbi:glycosyltransferase [Devosia sediminis]|uniref:Glycosyltransferase n=1 Tax=Devosia sediminis TaxID=2798801 RepID=A0A934ISW9_9HYPH|nr:glycosyltransferase [Devosia sediminis]MBJ3786173.1 glycosyltransferase [Devosia sediminis]